METKIMQIFYDNNALPYKDKERQVHYPITGQSFSGASLTTEIRFYTKEIGGVDSITWVANAKRPDGKIAYQQLTANYDSEVEESYVSLQLSQWFTEKKGDLFIALNGYAGGVDIQVDEDSGLYTVSGTPIIQATGSIKVIIAYAPIMNNGYGAIPEITVQQALALVNQKLDKSSNKYVKHIDNIDNLNNASNQDYIANGDIVFASDTEELYSVSGLYPNLVATLIEHGVVLPNVSLINYQLSDEQYEKLTHNNSFIVYQNNIYKKTHIGETDEYRLTKITYIGNDTYNITQYYIYVLNSTKVIVSSGEQNNNFYTSDKIDSLLETIRGNEFTLVDTTHYPTLESFLLSTGMEGVIYLYPVGDTQNNYYKYIWENSSWISLGTTEFDLSQYYNKTEIDNFLSEKEDVENKTTTLSASSTDTQYPSAKAVYDLTQDIREVAEGKCKTVVISYEEELIEENDYGVSPDSFYYTPDGTKLETWSDFLSFVGAQSSAAAINSFANALFDSDNQVVDVGQKYIITDEAFQKVYRFGDNLNPSDFKIGDIILVEETNVPDRWFDSNGYVFKLETSKVDLNNVYKKNANIIPTSTETYDIGEQAHTFNRLYLSSGLYFYDGHEQNGGNISLSYPSGDPVLTVESDWDLLLSAGNYIYANASFLPDTTNSYDIGSSTKKWKDAYFNGNVNVGNSTVYKNASATYYYQYYVDSSNNLVLRSSTDGSTYSNKVLFSTPDNNIRFDVNVCGWSNGSHNLGTSTRKWADIWVNNLKGIATLTQAQYDALATKDPDTFYFIEEE